MSEANATPSLKNKGGRASLLTHELTAQFVQHLKNGNFRDPVCKLLGVHVRTFRRWMMQGAQETEGKYHDFRKAILEAENEAEVNAVAHIMQVGMKDAKYLQWWLERKFPERWGRVNDTLKALADEIKLLKNRLESTHAKPV